MVTITASTRETAYSPTTSTTDFPCDFPIFGQNVGEFPTTDLEVEVNGEVTTAFTVVATFADGISTDALVRLNSGVTGDVIVRGKRTPRRTDQYANGAPLPITAHNYSLNRLEAEMQEVRRDATRATDGLAQEVEDRIAADDAERAARIAADQNLNGRVDEEIIDRINGDNALASLIGQAGPIEVPLYDTRLALSLANIKSTINAIRTGGYSVAGDGGDALYRRRTAIEVDAYGDVTSNEGTVRWALVGNEFRLKQFGAVEGSDVADIVEGALTLGKKLVVDGIYTASNAIVYSGGVHIVGASDKAEIHWPADAESGGFKFVASSWKDNFEVSYLKITTASAGLWSGVEINWANLSAPDATYDHVRARVHHNWIAGVDTAGDDISDNKTGWLYGVNLPYMRIVDVYENTIYGAWDGGSYNTNGESAWLSVAGIYVPDQAVQNLNGLKAYNIRIFYSRYGVVAFNVEGFELFGNDIQVCWFGVLCNNTIRTVNQYRMYNNHIGVYAAHIRMVNCRQVLIIGNEISYRYGRTDISSIVYLIVFDGVKSGAIIGNSLRGNVQGTNIGTYTMPRGLILTDNGTELAQTNRISVDGNQFQSLDYAYVVAANAYYNVIGSGNTYQDIKTQIGLSSGASAIGTAVMGSGTQDLAAGTVPAVYARALNGAPIIAGRELSTGRVIGIRYDGTEIGSITTDGSSTTYNTTSDSTLKTDKGELSVDDAVNIIKLISVHNFDWNATGESDIGAFAQELYEVYPKAVYKGGWFLPEDDSTEVDEGTEGAYYRSWMVDYSKLIPVILRALQGLISGST